MLTSANNKNGQCGKGRLAKEEVRCSQNLTGCVSASSASVPFLLVVVSFFESQLGCVSHYHIDLQLRGTDVDNHVVWPCAYNGSVVGGNHCQ